MKKFISILITSAIACGIYFGASFLINSLTGTKCASCKKTIAGKVYKNIATGETYCSEWCAGTWNNR